MSSSDDVTASSSPSRRRPARPQIGAAAVCCLCKEGGDRLDGDLHLLTAGPLGLATHYHCLLFASGLHQNGRDEDEGQRGFLWPDIQRELRRGLRLKCVYCKLNGATVGCARAQCKKSYHLPCGIRHQSLQQHFDQFKSFCSVHRPAQKLRSRQLAAAVQAECGICMASVEPKPNFNLLFAPCCGGWLHRTCLDELAKASVDNSRFACPICANDTSTFIHEMLVHGIQVPERDAEHTHCNAKICLSEVSRSQAAPDGLWKIVVCIGCRKQGIHVKCGGLDDFVDPLWFCYSCRRVRRASSSRPIITCWGSAKATYSGTSPKSKDEQREEIFNLAERSRVRKAIDPMNVTLEDVIVKGLEEDFPRKIRRRSKEQSSPGDSDYESAHEPAFPAAAIRKTALPIICENGETLDQKIENSIKSFFLKQNA